MLPNFIKQLEEAKVCIDENSIYLTDVANAGDVFVNESYNEVSFSLRFQLSKNKTNLKILFEK